MTLSRQLTNARLGERFRTMPLFAWWRNFRTAYALASRIEDLEAEWDEVRQDWIDKRDALDRLLRRLTLRDTRARDSRQEAVEATIPAATGTDGPPAEKLALFDRARSKGLIR